MPVNIEIKARCSDPERIAGILGEFNAEYRGEDHQVDTYFRVPEGKLKLREGNIEHSLIYYKRDALPGPKRSDVLLYKPGDEPGLREILRQVLGIKVVVDKVRRIYFIDNVKFHIDTVEKLGSFVEIEAIGEEGNEAELEQQCRKYLEILGIMDEDLLPGSYSELINETAANEK